MKRLMVAVIAVVGLTLLGHGTLRAAGQPNANPQQNGAAPSQQFGTSSDVAAKKRLDEQKYQKSPAELSAGARPETSSSKKE